MHRMTQNFVFDRRTQEHIAMRGGEGSHTESTECTEKSPRICTYLLVFFLCHEWARIFTNAMRSGIVSRRRRRPSQKHAEQILCISVSSFRFANEKNKRISAYLCKKS